MSRLTSCWEWAAFPTLDATGKGLFIMNILRMKYPLSFALGGTAALVAAIAWAQTSEDIHVIAQAIERDAYAAHREIELRSSVDGDFVAAGGRVTIDGEVAGDVIVAARNVEINSQVNDDLRVAGQHIHVTSPIAGHIVAAGQTVTIDEDVGEWAWLAGHTVEVSGNVGSDLKIRAEQITLNAEVTGDIEMIGGNLDLGPKTVVRGDLTWRSDNEANISPDAQVDGQIVQEAPPGVAEKLADADAYSLPINMIIAVILLFLLFSRPLRTSTESIATRPWRSLLLGALAFIVVPMPAVLLFYTHLSIGLGFTVLLIYFALLLLGMLTGLFAVSDITLRKFREQPVLWQSLAAIFVTVVLVRLLLQIPWFGFAFFVAIVMLGVGALCGNSWATFRKTRRNELRPS